MALQWMILAYVVAAEAARAVILTLPTPKAIQSRIASVVSRIVQPSLFIIPFSAFQLLDIYWKSEHRLKCKGETCTAAERERYEKSEITVIGEDGGLILLCFTIAAFYKAQRNVILCVSACLLYWCIYRICNYHKDIQRMEKAEKRAKDE